MSLDLDKRQRAMLREMGVQVWSPQAENIQAAQPAVTAPVRVAAPAAAPVQAVPTQAAAVSAPAAAPRPRVQPPAAPPPAVAAAVPASLPPRPQADLLDWAGLQSAVAGCQACRLCESRKNTVFGVGPTLPGSAQAPAVDWLIVGEAPGENEDLAGEPFVGQAGKLLDNMLQAMKLQRGAASPARADISNSVFITNVLKCRPPANRNPDPAEVAQCEPYLKRQVELLQPKVIIAMGKFAAQSLLQHSVDEVQKIPLGKLRGQVHEYLGVPVVVTYHPAYLLRSLPDKAKAWDDLRLAMARLKGPA